MSELDKEEYTSNLKSSLEDSIKLRDSIPSAINVMSCFHDAVKKLPRLQSDLNASKRKLNLLLQKFLIRLKNAYDLVGEFITQIEYKIFELEKNK